jgi:hypothetical protein
MPACVIITDLVSDRVGHSGKDLGKHISRNSHVVIVLHCQGSTSQQNEYHEDSMSLTCALLERSNHVDRVSVSSQRIS